MNKISFFPLVLLFLPLYTFGQIRNPRNLPYQWITDTSRHSVELSDLTLVVSKDALPILNFPEFILKNDEKYNFYDFEPVIAISYNGESKAYPVNMITLYELANDSIGLEKVMITYCPRCNSGMVFSRKTKKDGKDYLLDFAVSGILLNDDMIMYDKQTNSWWDEHMGEAIVGELAGTELKVMRAQIISAKEFFEKYPDGKILSPKGIKIIDKKSEYPPFYTNKDNENSDTTFFISEKVDSRLPPLERVVDVNVMDHTTIYPFAALGRIGVINEFFNNLHFVIFYHNQVVSVSNKEKLSNSQFNGSAMVFRSLVNGANYTFYKKGNYFYDDQTESTWDITGYCLKGSLKDKQLMFLPNSNHFAFAYLAYFPDAQIYGQ